MLLSVECNIGSGKSTFCKYIKERFSEEENKPDNKKVYFLDEPVSEWESIKNSEGNLLENFYKNPDKYAFCFQMAAYISRLVKLKDMIKEVEQDAIIITERSVFSDYNIFARMLHKTKKINDIEFEVYNKWFYYFVKDIPDILFVYIKTSSNNCHDRVLKRSRKGEDSITLDYLDTCGCYHDNWLEREKNKIILDGNKDTTFHSEYLDIIKNFIGFSTNSTPKITPGNTEEDVFQKIIHCVKTVNNDLGNHYRENIYQYALYTELNLNGFMVQTEVIIPVYYKGVYVGFERADIVIYFPDCIYILELKSQNSKLSIKEITQLRKYMTNMKCKKGLLINFFERLEIIEVSKETSRKI